MRETRVHLGETAEVASGSRPGRVRVASTFRFPSGESFLEIQARMVGAITEIADNHRGEVVVAVSHADTIKAAIASALGTPLDLFQRIHISPCSLSAVLFGQNGPMVLAVNSTGDELSAALPSSGKSK